MSREIKFRCWDENRNVMYRRIWIYEDHVGIPEEEVIRVLGKDYEPFDEAADFHVFLMSDYILEQFTGLSDKQGKPIYEGDIVRNERGEVGKIVFGGGSFVSQYLPPYDWDAMEKHDGLLDRQTVIGNIHENPDLLVSENKEEPLAKNCEE